MKKRIMSMVTVLLALCLVSGWNLYSSQNGQEEINYQKDNIKTEAKKGKAKQQPAANGEIDDTDFTVKYEGVMISLGDDFAKIVGELPAADEITEAKSCIGSGTDKLYTFGDLCITTNVNGKIETVYSIEVIGDAVTSCDLAIGASLKDIEKAYGKQYEKVQNLYTYILNEKELSFEMENDKVTAIEYYLVLE